MNDNGGICAQIDSDLVRFHGKTSGIWIIDNQSGCSIKLIIIMSYHIDNNLIELI